MKLVELLHDVDFENVLALHFYNNTTKITLPSDHTEEEKETVIKLLSDAEAYSGEDGDDLFVGTIWFKDGNWLTVDFAGDDCYYLPNITNFEVFTDGGGGYLYWVQFHIKPELNTNNKKIKK